MRILYVCDQPDTDVWSETLEKIAHDLSANLDTKDWGVCLECSNLNEYALLVLNTSLINYARKVAEVCARCSNSKITFGTVQQALKCFEAGVDVFLPAEVMHDQYLSGAINAVLRNIRPDADDTLINGNVELCVSKRTVHVDEARVHLGTTPFNVFAALMKRPGMIFTRDSLLDLCWSDGVELDDRAVDNAIRHIRKSFKPHECPIRTVYGAGYSYSETVG